MKILLATSNPHKSEEILAVFREMAEGGEVPMLMTLGELGREIDEPVEDEPTFEGNAVKKARHYAAASGMVCLADDSGLEVDALGGEPGVKSARYSGTVGPRDVVDPANNLLLLERMSDVPVGERGAKFVCAMALAWPDESKEPVVVRGTIEGRILTELEADDVNHPERGRGENGFGYDPLFLVPKLGRTTAELSPEDKNAISHRGDAARKMWERMRGLV